MQDSPCRICKKPLYPQPMGEKNGYSLVACKSCGSVMVSPWIEQDELDQFFGDVQPEITHLPDPDAEIKTMVKNITAAAKGVSGKRFLDVSCRQGYGVMAAKQLGFDAKGIDSHDFMIRFAQKEYDATLFEHVSAVDYAATGVKADVVFSLESLCEQPDPESFVAALAALTAPGGVVYMEEPDGNNFNLPRIFTKWALVEPPLNFLYISKRGLLLLLKRHGFRVKKIFFSWAPMTRLIAVRNKT